MSVLAKKAYLTENGDEFWEAEVNLACTSSPFADCSKIVLVKNKRQSESWIILPDGLGTIITLTKQQYYYLLCIHNINNLKFCFFFILQIQGKKGLISSTAINEMTYKCDPQEFAAKEVEEKLDDVSKVHRYYRAVFL